MYRRLEKETDPDVKKLFQERRSIPYRSLMRTTVLVVEKVKEVAGQLGYGLVINEGKTCYLYNKVFWEPINELDLKHFLGKAFQKMGADKYTARNVRIANKVHEQACYSLYRQTERDKGVVKINLTNTTLVIGHDGSVKEQALLMTISSMSCLMSMTPKRCVPCFISFWMKYCQPKMFRKYCRSLSVAVSIPSSNWRRHCVV